jgi:hypothetical protein
MNFDDGDRLLVGDLAGECFRPRWYKPWRWLIWWMTPSRRKCVLTLASGETMRVRT